MQKPSMQNLQEESQIAFRKQFDPTSESYHNGLKEPVPLGGDRVPDSMYSMYPEGYDPNQPQQVPDYGEEYKKVEAQREVYQKLKKSLAKLCPIVQGFFRHEQIFKEKGDTSNQKHIKVHEENMKKQQQNLKIVQKQLEDFLPTLKGCSEQGQLMGKQLMQILQQSNKKHESKQTLGEFNFKVKKLSTQTFSSAQKCLQKLKDIKKSYNKKKEEEAKQKTEQTEKKQEEVKEVKKE